MGREIRRVPPDWEHPKSERGHFQPMYDEPFGSKMDEWYENWKMWEEGEHPDQLKYPEDTAGSMYWEWNGKPPDPEYHRPTWTEEQATAYQIYENVSEGTPTSPVFRTVDEMRKWLLEQGHSEYVTDEFLKAGYAFSLVFTFGKGISEIGIDSFDLLRDH